MNASTRPCRPLLAVALTGMFASTLLPPAAAATQTTRAEDEAVAACEQAARRSLSPKTARAAEVTFKTAPALRPGLSNERQIVLSGEGRWRSAEGLRNVTYTCNVDRRTFEATGLVIRDTAPGGSKPARVRKPAEPDLSQLSLASCESSAVQALQRRWPSVSDIRFDSDTRSFRQESVDHAALRGRGRALPVKDAPDTFFGFVCEIDPKDGWVLKTRVTE